MFWRNFERRENCRFGYSRKKIQSFCQKKENFEFDWKQDWIQFLLYGKDANAWSAMFSRKVSWEPKPLIVTLLNKKFKLTESIETGTSILADEQQIEAINRQFLMHLKGTPLKWAITSSRSYLTDICISCQLFAAVDWFPEKHLWLLRSRYETSHIPTKWWLKFQFPLCFRYYPTSLTKLSSVY